GANLDALANIDLTGTNLTGIPHEGNVEIDRNTLNAFFNALGHTSDTGIHEIAIREISRAAAESNTNTESDTDSNYDTDTGPSYEADTGYDADSSSDSDPRSDSDTDAREANLAYNRESLRR